MAQIVESLSYSVEEQRRSRPVILYSKVGFQGECLRLNRDWTSRGSQDDWDNEIASIEVPYGIEVWLYEHPSYKGKTLIVSGYWSVKENPWWRDRISSVRIINSFEEEGCTRQTKRNHHGYNCRELGGATIYEHPHFNGASKTIYDSWSKRDSDDFWDDRINSVKVPAGYIAILYKHPGFQGRSLILRGPTSVELEKDFWNDEVSSIEVFRR